MASSLSDIAGTDGVDVTVYEIDSKVENVKVTIQGENINYDKIIQTIETSGATVHSIDKVACGKELIKEVSTHQDSPA